MLSFAGAARWAALCILAFCVSWGCQSNASDPQQDSGAAKKSDVAAEAAEDLTDPTQGLEDHPFPLLVWSARVVQSDYFDPERFDPKAQLLSATRLLGLHNPAFFAQEVSEGAAVKITVRSQTAEFSLTELDRLTAAAERLEQILVFAQDVLELEEEPLHELEYAAINGMFAPLDPHTILLTPEEHADLGVRTRGRFGGIGAQIREEGRRILIVKVLPAMPADKVGLRGGDVLLKIDNESTVNMTSAEARERLRGPIGTNVRVKVRREGKTLDFEIERDTIRIDSVQTEVLPGAVTYLRVSTFQQDTADKVAQALAAHEDATGVIIDLRGNSGGLLAQATEMVDLFVKEGDLVIVRSAAERVVDAAHDEVGVSAKTPIVVLVDEESASAAEIVSGGLKALGRAVIVGRGSFGKGSVQLIKPQQPYGRELALKMTVAEYLVAGDQRIQSYGVLPHLVLQPVELSEMTGIARFFDDERFERQRERSRTANLPSAKHDPPSTEDREPVARVRYLWTADLPDGLWPDTAGKPASETPPPPDALKDPEVRLARRVAVALAGTSTEAEREARVRTLATELTAEQDTQIVAALAKTKIDWSAGPTGALSAAMKVVDAQPLAAGEPFTIEVKITNAGDTPVHRVHAITDCVHDELDGIELLVGTVAAGATETRTMRMRVMPWHTDFIDSLALAVHVGEPAGKPIATSRSLFEVQGAPRPALAYDYWIVDDPALVASAPKRPTALPIPGDPPWEVRGNGDGVLQPGEQVLLAFIAENKGTGPSPDVRAILRNLSGEQGLIEEGAARIGALAPGAKMGAAFGITVDKRADPAKPFEVELAIGDARMRTRAQDKLLLRILAASPTLEAETDRLRVEGDTVRIYAGAHASTPIVAEVPESTVLATTAKIGGWRVVAGDGGRRYYVPEGKALVADKGRGATLQPSDFDRPAAVLPPSIKLESFPMRTDKDAISLKGVASHPIRMRDVVVMVRPPGPAQIEEKVSYAANPWTQSEGAGTLEFEAVIPLSPGGNRVTILARDSAKVEQRHDVWIYREGGGPS